MKSIKILAMALAAALCTSAYADTYYVSKETGSNRKDGLSADKPMKNLQKALDAAPAGSTILVAEGNYFGTLDCGNILITKPVTIIGGYSTDFTTRDVLKYKTLIEPTAESNGTAKGNGTMQIKLDGGKVVIDGLLFNRGNSIAYNGDKDPNRAGKPEGVDSGMMQPIGAAGVGGPDLSGRVLTTETSEIYLDNPTVDLVIKNCAFVNAPNYAIRGMFKGTAEISNNIFVALRMAGLELRGSSAKENAVVKFHHNTLLFAWSRLKDQGDMGYGYRYMPGLNAYIDHNIIGCTIMAALDRGHVDSDKKKEAARVTTATNNIFFLNKQADLMIPGGGQFMRIWAKDFEDVEQLAEVEGNKTLKDPSVFKGKLDEAYLNGFLNASYKEKTDYDPNSAANTFRAAMGMNMVGKMESSATMFMNRYPFAKALELFGAVEGTGAQMPK